MGAFAVRDLREHTGDLVRNAENGAYSVVSKYGKPLFVALPFNADLCCAAPNSLLMIVDERRARRVASRLGVPVIGSGTLIAQLKRQGCVQSVKPVLSSWKEHGYFASEPFVRDILCMTAEL